MNYNNFEYLYLKKSNVVPNFIENCLLSDEVSKIKIKFSKKSKDKKYYFTLSQIWPTLNYEYCILCFFFDLIFWVHTYKMLSCSNSTSFFISQVYIPTFITHKIVSSFVKYIALMRTMR